MNVVKEHKHGEVQSLELGFGPIGPPLMTVRIYLVDGTLFDTAQRNMRSEVLNWLQPKNVDRVVLTHHHEDHVGNAAVVLQAKGVEGFAHPLTVAKMEGANKIFPYQHLVWGKSDPVVLKPFGETIETDNLSFVPIHTPGHSKDHTVYLEPNRGWLFSGDLYLADRIKYFRADEKIGDQIDSIRRVLTYDFDTLFCCHRPQETGGKQHLQNKLAFLEDFYGNVEDLYAKGYEPKAIRKTLGLKEELSTTLLCWGNVSLLNMIRSTIDDIETKANEAEPIATTRKA